MNKHIRRILTGFVICGLLFIIISLMTIAFVKYFEITSKILGTLLISTLIYLAGWGMEE